jgi:DeoR family fructose operon transcriptional repressor
MKPRHQWILHLLEQNQEADLRTLVRALDASEATIRRDLDELENAGRIVRTFGGARIAPPRPLTDQVFGDRTLQMRREKQWIARAAAALVKPGMMVALDSGTTAWTVARELKEKTPLTILTVGLAPVEELGGVPGITIFLVGGRFLLENLSFVSADTVESLQHYRADIAFVGLHGLIPSEGAFSANRVGADVGAALSRCANRRVIVADHSKIGVSAPYLILPPQQIDTFVTDSDVPAKLRQALAKEPYEVIYAEKPKLT